jgi:hypothetical protein
LAAWNFSRIVFPYPIFPHMIPFLMDRVDASGVWAIPRNGADDSTIADKIVFPANSLRFIFLIV